MIFNAITSHSFERGKVNLQVEHEVEHEVEHQVEHEVEHEGF